MLGVPHGWPLVRRPHRLLREREGERGGADRETERDSKEERDTPRTECNHLSIPLSEDPSVRVCLSLLLFYLVSDLSSVLSACLFVRRPASMYLYTHRPVERNGEKEMWKEMVEMERNGRPSRQHRAYPPVRRIHGWEATLSPPERPRVAKPGALGVWGGTRAPRTARLDRCPASIQPRPTAQVVWVWGGVRPRYAPTNSAVEQRG